MYLYIQTRIACTQSQRLVNFWHLESNKLYTQCPVESHRGVGRLLLSDRPSERLNLRSFSTCTGELRSSSSSDSVRIYTTYPGHCVPGLEIDNFCPKNTPAYPRKLQEFPNRRNSKTSNCWPPVFRRFGGLGVFCKYIWSWSCVITIVIFLDTNSRWTQRNFIFYLT